MRENVGTIPGGFNPAIIHLVGAIVTWWGRSEALIVQDVLIMRRSKFAIDIAAKEPFFNGRTKSNIKQWGKLLKLLYGDSEIARQNISMALEQALKSASDRDTIVHSFWPYWQDDYNSITLLSYKQDKTDPSLIRTSKIKATVEDLDDINEGMVRLYNMVFKIHLGIHQRLRAIERS